MYRQEPQLSNDPNAAPPEPEPIPSPSEPPPLPPAVPDGDKPLTVGEPPDGSELTVDG